ncbi:MAG: Holliday junction resolvase RuvX [Acidimicrobiales bacterium]|nr:Holliday junction resolvase RuvX [Acidimicrobiales bacterium]
MRALALDLGSKRIGVAVSDSDGRVATPITTIHRSGNRARDHRAVADLVAEWEAEIVVVGLPLSLDGSVGKAAKRALAEVRNLGATLSVPVETYDERLTTVTAERVLVEQQLDGRARRQVVDQVAASIILQAWLDHRANTPPGDTPPDDSSGPMTAVDASDG